MYPLWCKERGCRKSSGRENGARTAVGGGRFQIKGVLHAYDRWKVDNGKPSLRNLSPWRIRSNLELYSTNSNSQFTDCGRQVRAEIASARTPNFARRIMERSALIE